MKTRSNGLAWGWLAAAVGLAGCGGSSEYAAKAPPASPANYGYSSHTSSAAPAEPGAPIADAPPPVAARSESAPPRAARKERDAEMSAGERPGLGTEWGETRWSHVNNVSFDRADPSHPSQVLS